jgi:ApeA N-terminal domain 1
MDYSKLPKRIQPIYSTNYPNETIHLYKGDIECIYEINGVAQNSHGTGSIEYAWFPTPRSIFKIDCNEYIHHEYNFIGIKLPISPELISVNINSWENNSHTISGSLAEPSNVGVGSNLNSITFHIVNSCYYHGLEGTYKESEGNINWGRVSFYEGDWEIIIDQVTFPGKKGSWIFDELQKSGGCAITHVGEIRKKENNPFDYSEASELIDLLSDFLSFAMGTRVPIVLSVGHNSNGSKVFEQWGSLFVQSWKSKNSWFPERELQNVPAMFPIFVNWSRDWGQAARTIINMYLNANHNYFRDISIVLSYSNLEMIARVILVEKRERIGASKFDKLLPADKITNLLKELSIPTTFPPSSNDSIDDLMQFVKISINASDLERESTSKSLLVLSKIRNNITHAKKKYQPSSMAIFDSANLSLWYVEVVILAILNYHGLYKNRLDRSKRFGKYVPVPWFKPHCPTPFLSKTYGVFKFCNLALYNPYTS